MPIFKHLVSGSYGHRGTGIEGVKKGKDVLLSIINVSVQTVDIVDGLPKVDF